MIADLGLVLGITLPAACVLLAVVFILYRIKKNKSINIFALVAEKKIYVPVLTLLTLFFLFRTKLSYSSMKESLDITPIGINNPLAEMTVIQNSD